MTLRKISITILIAMALAVTASCAGVRPKAQAPTPKAAGIKEIEGPVTAALLRDYILFNNISSIRSEVSVKVLKNDKVEGRANGVFVFKSPGSMRLRLYDPFGATIMDMVKAGSRMQILTSSNASLYEGWTPPLGPPGEALYAMEDEGGSYTLYAFLPVEESEQYIDLAARYAFTTGTLLNTRASVYNKGREFITLYFNSFGPDRAPAEIVLSFVNGLSTEITLKEPVINGDVSDDLFSPLPRRGLKVRSIQEALRSSLKLD